MFNRFLKMVIGMWNFMNKVYNGRFAPNFSVSVLTETSSRILNYVYETRYHGNKMWYNKSAQRFFMVNGAMI